MDKPSAAAATPIDASLFDKLLSNQLSEADARQINRKFTRRRIRGEPTMEGYRQLRSSHIAADGAVTRPIQSRGGYPKRSRRVLTDVADDLRPD